MKKFVLMLVVLVMLLSCTAVLADSFENKVYTFSAVNTTATFDAEGEALSIDNEAVLRFEKGPVTMQLDGNADDVVFCSIVLTKYDSSEILYTLSNSSMATATRFKDGNLGEIVIQQGAYLLILSTVEEQGSAVIILVGEQTVVPEGETTVSASNKFSDDALISSWATTELSEAYDCSLITTELYQNNNYQRNISRGEFAHVMAQVLIQCGADYDKFVENLGSNPTLKFTDTNNDLEIEFVSSCGIINGMSETEFMPQGELTREQAAAMLARTLVYLKLNPTLEKPAAFSDEAQFSSWATDSIYTVAALRDKVNNLAVMGGMGEGIFSPKTGYTVEQALISAKRLLRAVK